MIGLVALDVYLDLFKPYLAMPNTTEICINKPYEIWVEHRGHFECFESPELSLDFLWKFAQLVAASNERAISREYPTLSSTLPNGLRIQFVIEPACERGSFICSIRQKRVITTTLDDYFIGEELLSAADQSSFDLAKAYQQKNNAEFLRLAVLQKKNIIIAGGTSTGKTTLLNTLVQLIPREERIITIETDREVICPHPNSVHLLATEEGKSVAEMNMLGLLKASLRLRPDRILVSELRGEEAFAYLRAINSGHPGSITTIHADSPMSCFEQLALMMQGSCTFSRQEIIAYAKAIVNVIVQIKRTDNGKRYISEIYFDEALKK